MLRSPLLSIAILAALTFGPHAAVLAVSAPELVVWEPTPPAPQLSRSPSSGPVWLWPVRPPHAIARPFIAPASEYGAGHRGIDILGSEVFAPADGIVHFAGRVVDRSVLSIDHGGGLISSFEPITTELSKGDRVARGDPIGAVDVGHCDSACVHFGVRRDGEYISPLLFLGTVERAVLLPTREL